MSTNERIRGHELQRIRDRFRRNNPLCVSCLEKGRVRAWTQLDHIIALENGGTDTDDNRQGLCDECHDVKTREDMNYQPSGACSSDGLPTDPNHPWNK